MGRFLPVSWLRPQRRAFEPHEAASAERGINMVDLMAWLVIAALLLAAALQGIGYYQQTALTYQAKSDLSGEHSWAAGRASVTGQVPTSTDLQNALNDGDLKLSSSGGSPNVGVLASSGGSAYCLGVQATGLSASNVFYSSSNAPNNIQRAASLTDPLFVASCGTASTAAAPSGTGGTTSTATASASPSPTATATTSPHLFTSLALAQQSGAPAMAAGVASSSDGSILVASNDQVVGGSTSGYLVRSTDAGKTWAQITAPGSQSWYGVSSSSDGKTILAVANNGLVWLSKDGGSTWASDPGTVTGSSDAGTVPASKLGTQYWAASAVSRNGQTLVVASGHNGAGHLWWSEDGGSTWTQHGSADFRAVSTSNDGNTIAAADVSYGLWDMTISGTKGTSANWAQQGNNVGSKYTGISVSGDGKTVLAGMGDQYGCLVVGTRSTNDMTTGFTYTMLGMGGNNPGVPSDTYHVSISADGTKALAVGQNYSHVLTSLNLTSHPTTTDPTWPSYPSVTDGGFSTAKFTQQTPPSSGQWWSTAMSDDGSRIAFGSQNNVPLVTGTWN